MNILPTVPTDGVVYADAVPVTPDEADLNGGSGAQVTTPIPIADGQTIVAIVELWSTGHLTGNNTYIFLQTDLGDGVWVDVAWCRFTDTDTLSNNPAKFVLCGGGLGTMNNALGPMRRSNSAPATQANGSNALPLGGRCRFVGFGKLSGGSSSGAGLNTGHPVCNITYRIQHPR